MKHMTKTALCLFLLFSTGCSISIDNTTLDFGSTETEKTFTLRLIGAIEWEIDCDKDWVTVNPNQGQSDQLSQIITVTVERANLNPGNYEATLTISNNWGIPCPDVLIKMTVPTIPATTTSEFTTTITIPEIVQDSFVLSEFQYNSMDTHMHWDGTYLWLPETEYLNNDNRYSTNLIRLNPDDFSYIRYNLPQIDYSGKDTFPIVYEVVPSPSDSHILYISAPYGQPKSIYVFNKSNESADGFRLINEELVCGGNNGAKMAVTTSYGNDTVWITANDSKIGTFDVETVTMTGLYDFSTIAPSGLYGIAAVPTATPDTYILHVASFSGRLLIFPSDLTSINQSITIDVADYGLGNASLTALTYDEEYVWVAGFGRYNDSAMLFIMRYLPASQFDVVGECSFYWSNVDEGIVPSILSYGNFVFAVVENEANCYLRYLIRLNKTTCVVDDIEIHFQNPRVAASLGYDDKGKIYVGGYGCSSESIRPLELVRFTFD